MPISTSRQVAFLVITSVGSFLAAVQTGRAADGVIRVDDPYCNAPGYDAPCYTWRDSLCRKFRLHGIYIHRCCTQRYVMLPQSMAPYCSPAPHCPAPGAYGGYPYGGGVPGTPPAIVPPPPAYVR